MDWDLLEQGLCALGLPPLSGEAVEKLQVYLSMLREWNQKLNLTAVEAPQEIIIKHFLDSLSCRLVVRMEEQESLLDMGSGAGFPGLPLKIVAPRAALTLADSLAKRVAFLERVIARLSLSGARAMHARAEELGHDPAFRESFTLVTARAVARLNTLVEYTLPFVKVGGHCVAMKGPDPQAEIAEAERAIQTLGGEVAEVRELRLPVVDVGRSLILIRKVAPAPAEYPRRPGTPAKRPL
jgi:16S rRNA (guanine527-N7)-methyltransferase